MHLLKNHEISSVGKAKTSCISLDFNLKTSLSTVFIKQREIINTKIMYALSHIAISLRYS